MKIANTMEIRLQNAISIIGEIENKASITNTEIAENQGLSVPTISNIVNILKNDGLVTSVGVGESSGGRKPTQLSLNKEYHYFLGLSIGRHKVYCALVDFAGTIIAKEMYACGFEDRDIYWDKINGIIDYMLKKAPGECAIGIAMPGIVDLENGLLKDAYTLELPGVQLDKIYKVLKCQPVIDDSCHLAAEAQIFANKAVEDCFFIQLNRRVSGAMIMNQSVLSFHESSIDIGGLIIDSTKKEAKYGAPGSMAELCSASLIIDLVKEEGINTYPEFFEKVDAGDAKCIKLWEEYLSHLAVATYNLFTLFKTRVVIGGEMAKYLEPYMNRLESMVRKIHHIDCKDSILHCSLYGEYDDAYGAALGARMYYLQDILPNMLRVKK